MQKSGRLKTVQGSYLNEATENLHDLILAATSADASADVDEDPLIPAFSIDDALEDLFLTRADFERILESLRTKRNLILQGPPGVGKTFIARRIAYALLGFRVPTRVLFTQFHQSMSYEDFVQGYRPTDAGKLY